MQAQIETGKEPAALGPLKESSVSTYSPQEIKRLLRKVDRRVIPILAILYFFSFLDRGNIGNADIQGLSADLNLVGNQYNWALTAFFFPYCFLEPICNLLLVKFKPSIWLPSIMVAWGVVTTLLGVVQNYSGLVAARFFLGKLRKVGVAEAGLCQVAVVLLIQYRYPRTNAQYRLAMIFASASMAGAFSGLLAFLIGKMQGVGGLEGWRWIFILEGIATVLVAVLSYFLVWDEPSTATFLSEGEKLIIIELLADSRASVGANQLGEKSAFDWRQVKQALLDWQTYLHALGYWGMACAVYALSLFLPTIIKGLGYSSANAQLLTIPVYAAASISCVVVGYFSDRTSQRSLFILASYMAVFVGYLIAVCPSRFIPGLTYAGCFIAASGIYPAIPGLLALSSNNYAPATKRAVGMAIQIGFGSLGGAAASNFYRDTDAPRYRLGHSLVLGFVSLGLLTVTLYYFLCRGVNAKRDREGDARNPSEVFDLGDKAPTFQYKL
ncbi:major facilitator superfamily domain-containing protein [Aspergillus ambiguus]|uniref:major facilitator superfamily domain-containing protein n=1 Tax=Aspergillus ambiguus TaxID=176160 RepID=UPI003CCD4AD7